MPVRGVKAWWLSQQVEGAVTWCCMLSATGGWLFTVGKKEENSPEGGTVLHSRLFGDKIGDPFLFEKISFEVA